MQEGIPHSYFRQNKSLAINLHPGSFLFLLLNNSCALPTISRLQEFRSLAKIVINSIMHAMAVILITINGFAIRQCFHTCQSSITQPATCFTHT